MLTSRQNAWVKTLRSLHQKKGRVQLNQCLLEGTHLLEAALGAKYPMDTFCYTLPWADRYPDLYDRLQQWASHSLCLSPELLAYAATTVTPDGAMAIVPQPTFNHLPYPQHLGLLMVNLQDPGNGGTIIRTAAATGLDGVWFSQDSVDLTHPKLLRASAGAWFEVPLGVCENVTDWIRHCQDQGVQCVATCSHGNDSYWDVDFQRPTLVIMGNEGSGLAPHLLDQADRLVTIPQNPRVESLNVAIATALLLYEGKRQRDYVSGANPRSSR